MPAPTGTAARSQLLALPGIGPWTAEMIAMRGLGDPDAFPATDLGVQLAAEQLGLPAHPAHSFDTAPAGARGGPMPCSTCGPPWTIRSTSGHRKEIA